MLGASLGNRRFLVDRPFVRMLGVHLNFSGLRIAGGIRSHDYVLGASITLGGLNRVLAVLVSLELPAVVGDRHRLVTVVDHVKRYALAIGAILPQVINDGSIGVHIGIRLFLIPLVATNPTDLLTDTIVLGSCRRNDLILPPAALPYLSPLAILAGLKVAAIARLPGSIVGNGMGTLLNLNLSIGRHIVIVILGIADVVRSRQKIG